MTKKIAAKKKTNLRVVSGSAASKPPEKMQVPLFSAAHRPLSHDSPEVQQAYPFDRLTHAWLGKMTATISPISLSMAFLDWAAHLAVYPAQRVELGRSAMQKTALLYAYMLYSLIDKDTPLVAQPRAHDKRFCKESWQDWPFNWYHQGFLLTENWWDEATKNVRGVSRHHEDVVNFTTRQIMDAFSPSIVPFMNPHVIETVQETGGMNFVQGAKNFLEDYMHLLSGGSPEGAENFIPGENVAITPGKVIYRNKLMELIQYEPQTEKTYPEPVLITPAWIMKYYILDLSPHNSLVKYLTEKGHTVFMISWKNPNASDRDLCFEDYVNHGVLDALETIKAIVPEQKIHTTGYCLGGTLLMLAAAYMAKKQMDVLKSITLFATQIDFEEAGELMLFIDESQLSYIEDSMWQQGYLDSYQMAGAFNLLRSNDLIWSRIIHDYHMGKRRPLNDLMAWNADTTRMPFKMHSEYLRRLFLNNELSGGRYKVNGETIALTDIRLPIFSVSTLKDHVAPWESVYKIHLYTDTDNTFVLTTGGHNAGIISEPGHKGRSYQIGTARHGESYVPSSIWSETTPHKDGSWWPQWQKWLAKRSGSKIKPPKMSKSLCDAPGTYVMQK